MARRKSAGEAPLIGLALIGAFFMWMYEQLGDALFWIGGGLILLIIGGFIISKINDGKAQIENFKNTINAIINGELTGKQLGALKRKNKGSSANLFMMDIIFIRDCLNKIKDAKTEKTLVGRMEDIHTRLNHTNQNVHTYYDQDGWRELVDEIQLMIAESSIVRYSGLIELQFAKVDTLKTKSSKIKRVAACKDMVKRAMENTNNEEHFTEQLERVGVIERELNTVSEMSMRYSDSHVKESEQQSRQS